MRNQTHYNSGQMYSQMVKENQMSQVEKFIGRKMTDADKKVFSRMIEIGMTDMTVIASAMK